MKNGHGWNVLLYLTNSITSFFIKNLRPEELKLHFEAYLIKMHHHNLKGCRACIIICRFQMEIWQWEEAWPCMSGLRIQSLFPFSTIIHV